MIICTADQPWQRGDGPGLHPDGHVAPGESSSETRALRHCPHCGLNFEIPRENVLCFKCGRPGADVTTEAEVEGRWIGVEVHAHHFPETFA